MRLPSRLSMAAPIVALAMLVSTNNVFAQRTAPIEAGRTTVNLACSSVTALGVSPGAVGPTRLCNGIVNLPVIGAAFHRDTARGRILHTGGLPLTAGETQVTLQSFVIDTTNAPVITGLVSVDGTFLGRLPLFDLALPSGITLSLKPRHGLIILQGVGVSLDNTAAGALNRAFDVSAFTGGSGISTQHRSPSIFPMGMTHTDTDPPWWGILRVVRRPIPQSMFTIFTL